MTVWVRGSTDCRSTSSTDPLSDTHGVAISDDDLAFLIALGQRIAEQRRTRAITQAQLAEQLGISQQAMNSFEKGRRRVPVSLLPVIAQVLDTTLDALVTDGTCS